MKHSYIYKASLGLLAVLLFTNYTSNTKPPPPDCEVVFNQMFDAIKQIKTLRYTLFAKERFDQKYIVANSLVKVNISPYKIYLRGLGKGTEVIWIAGQKDSCALVNTGGFPYFNMHLDPNGNLMHKNQHQTIERLGYAYSGSILYHSLAKYPDAYKKYVNYLGDSLIEGHLCYKMVITFPEFHYYKVIVKDKGETINTIADKFYLNNYEVLTANKMTSYENELKVGQTINLPNGYSKAAILFIRHDTHLPVCIKIYDDKGMLEEYGFMNLQVNSTIPDIEFTKSFAGYNF